MNITNNMLAAYAKGNATNEEKCMIRQYLIDHPDEMESVLLMMDEDIDLEPDRTTQEKLPYANIMENLDNFVNIIEDSEVTKPLECDIAQKESNTLPITAMVAQNTIDNLCVLHCESYILSHYGMAVNDEELLKESTDNGWLKPEGTAIYNIGRLCGMRGLNVATHYNSNVNDIKKSLQAADMVIAVLNSDVLNSEASNGADEDAYVCHISEPNHAVIVSDMGDDSISIIDSATPYFSDTYQICNFVKAWIASSCCIIIISNNDNSYEPHPIDLSDVDLTQDLIELREAIAENAHEVWAYNRKKEGWMYGPVRDDEKKTNPDLVPYNRLTESEKLYDREMAMETIKLLDKLGWEVKRKL